VTSFVEKKRSDGGWVNAGYMVLGPQVFDYIEGDGTTFERDPLERIAADGQLVAYQYDGFWQCMDTLRDKLQLEELIASDKAPWMRWDHA
jgi:glucose-1-phosphate cytidylyltransferase